MEKKVYLGKLHKGMYLCEGRMLFHLVPLCKLEKGTLLPGKIQPREPHLARYVTVMLSVR